MEAVLRDAAAFAAAFNIVSYTSLQIRISKFSLDLNPVRGVVVGMGFASANIDMPVPLGTYILIGEPECLGAGERCDTNCLQPGPGCEISGQVYGLCTTIGVWGSGCGDRLAIFLQYTRL